VLSAATFSYEAPIPAVNAHFRHDGGLEVADSESWNYELSF